MPMGIPSTIQNKQEPLYGEGSASDAGFPPMPVWFQDNRHFGNIEEGLRKVGMSDAEVAGIMGKNWYRFFAENFEPLP